jgi:anti-anti-sigma regulatory factor
MGEIATTPETLTLPDRLDMSTAAALRMSILNAAGDVVLDGAGVEVVTSPGIQILVAGASHLSMSGRSLWIKAASDAMLSCIDDLGIEGSMIGVVPPTENAE